MIRFSQVATPVSSEPARGIRVPWTVSSKSVFAMLRVIDSRLSDGRDDHLVSDAVVVAAVGFLAVDLRVLTWPRKLDCDLRLVFEPADLEAGWRSMWGMSEASQ